jgi:hypothetical protein
LGAALQRAVAFDLDGQRDAAESLLRQILALDCDNSEALHMLALITAHSNRLAEAQTLIGRAVAVDPRRPLFLRSQCEILRRLGAYDAAAAAGMAALALEPGDHVAATMLASIAYLRLDMTAAERWARHAMTLTPEYPEGHFELSKVLLVQGRFAEGWEENETRFTIAGAAPLMPPSPQSTGVPQWDGRRLGGTLLLIADQGFGDAIQFMRYIPWAQLICPRIVLALDAAIRPLVERRFPDVPLFTNWDELPAFAAYCPLSGLPRLHGTDLTSIPAPIPYVHADPAKAADWRARLQAICPPGARRVGFAWAGRPTHSDDMNRSMPLQALVPLADTPGLVWVVLQKGPARAQMAEVTWPAPLIDIGYATADFDDTVAVIDGLDLVITVDTVIAHLAGAMGKPVWLLLPHAPDWRWLLNRSDSPWYPTARLFRQPAPKDWAGLVSDVARALA